MSSASVSYAILDLLSDMSIVNTDSSNSANVSFNLRRDLSRLWKKR